jgi:hypothetical protein
MSIAKKILTTPLRIALSILLLGILTKILQWDFAPAVIIFAFSAIAILYTLRFWQKNPKVFVDYVKLVLVTFWTMNGIFRILDFPYTLFFQVITGISFITWFIMEGTAYFMDIDRRTKNSATQIWWNIAMVLGTLAIIMGSLLKILHWEFATPLLISGFFMVTLYILKDVFIAAKIEEKDRGSGEFQL